MKNAIAKKMQPLVALAVFLMTSVVFGQPKTHKGFYLSMALGPAFGNISCKSETEGDIKITGAGAGFDLQIGGAVRENIILHATLGSKMIMAPTIVIDGEKAETGESVSVNEDFFGAGVTCYLKNNFFVTGNIGSGNFSMDVEDFMSAKSDNGFSFQLKAGKEWWVSPKWGLGVVLEYGATALKDRYDGNTDKWNSNRFTVRFSATLNRKK